MSGTLVTDRHGRVPTEHRQTVHVSKLVVGETVLIDASGRPQVLRRIDPCTGPLDAVGVAVHDTGAATLHTHVTIATREDTP